MSLLTQLGLRPLAGAKASAAKTAAARPAPPGSAPLPPPKARKKPVGEVELGGPVIIEQALGPTIKGPRIGELMALMSADGSGPLNRNNSALGGQINRDGAALHTNFAALVVIERRWRERYDGVQKMAARSAVDVKKMEQSLGAVGGRSKDRGGAYVRKQSEDYVKADREVKNALREIATAEEGLRKSVSAVHKVALEQQKLQQGRTVETLKGDVEAEKKRIAEAKSRLEAVFDIGLKVLKQDWTGLAEDAAKYVIGEVFDSIPTQRLDELNKQLEVATSKLKQLEDEVLLADMETASAGMREAALKLQDARQDLVARLADLRLARKTAVEALGESGRTADAAKMIERRGQMFELMAATRTAIREYQAASPAVTKAIASVDSLCKSYPAAVRSTPGVDANSDHARSLIATADANRDALANWGLYVQQEENSCRTALELLDKKGPGSFVEHFDRVAELVQTALEGR